MRLYLNVILRTIMHKDFFHQTGAIIKGFVPK